MAVSMRSELRETYATDGFAVQRTPILPAGLVERAAAGLEMVRDGGSDTGEPIADKFWDGQPTSLVKMEQPQLASRAVREVIAWPELGRLAGEIVGEATGAKWVQAWWVQLLIKPSAVPGASANVNIGWHQDRQYWKDWTDESELFTAWLALSDVTADSGPMVFARGSHRWGLLDQGNFFNQDQTANRKAIRVPEGQTWDEVPATMAPGGVSFHHRLTFHGSTANTSGRPRRSLAIHMRTDKSEHKDGAWVGNYLARPEICPVIWRG